MSKRQGYEFEKEIKNSLEKLKESVLSDLWFYKMVDTHSFDWIKDEFLDTKDNANKLTVPRVPADFISICNGKTVFLECKSTRDTLGFPIANIKQHQLQSSESIEKAGAKYLFLICLREPYDNITFIIESVKLNELIRTLRSGKIKKSKIPWSLISENSVARLEKEKKGLWDLSPLKKFFSEEHQ